MRQILRQSHSQSHRQIIPRSRSANEFRKASVKAEGRGAVRETVQPRLALRLAPELSTWANGVSQD
jgi:hypothetical protein